MESVCIFTAKEFQIEDELSSYDEGAQGPYHHIWHYRDDVEWERDIFFNSPSNGLETLQVIDVSSDLLLQLQIYPITQEKKGKYNFV